MIEKDALPIKQVSTSKSLGVRIDGSLSWECHINEISKKFASGISAIKCIRYFLPFEILLNIYNFLVQPHFEFCDGVWRNCSKNLSSKLQKLQTHAAHVLTFSNYECSTSELFQNLKWSKLVHQRVVSKAIMMHRPPQPRAAVSVHNNLPDLRSQSQAKHTMMHSIVNNTVPEYLTLCFVRHCNLTS